MRDGDDNETASDVIDALASMRISLDDIHEALLAMHAARPRRRERIATAVLTGIATPAYRDHAGAAAVAVKLADALIDALDAPVSP